MAVSAPSDIDIDAWFTIINNLRVDCLRGFWGTLSIT